MYSELKDVIIELTSEINKLREEIKELRKANVEINSKLYLTNEYLSTLEK